MIGYAATIRIRISDGETISHAKRRSGIPRERRGLAATPVTLAASIVG
jgi:hypothetical protein